VTSGGAATSVSTAGLGNFDRQAVSMRQQIRVNFTGKTTLDNGMTVGVLVGSTARMSRSPTAPAKSTAPTAFSAASSARSASVKPIARW
jgi:hypothetical protein